ncbi:hypothetical protein QE152_g10259 [Popillia japonica]|uniref:Uncharacterized protein n=1 Tax=Popillia japonica TaxID=7064 RepID=A0AAW1LUT4_POPJA
MALWSKHISRASKFSCEPRPKALLLSSLIKGVNIRNIIPKRTVLHRCGGTSGICTNHLAECMVDPKGIQNIRLPFLVIEGKKRYVFYNVSNHTSCICEVPSISVSHM